MARRQSISSKDVVGTNENITLPSSPVNGISGVQYFDAPVNDGQASDPDTGTGGIIEQLATPRDLKIESQTVKFTPDGKQYVTIVVSFETEEAAIGHEVRISEA